jgi:hypothetical protein
MTNNIVDIIINELEASIYEVVASYIDDCGKEYTAKISGEFLPWEDEYVPMFKNLAYRVICKALKFKEDYTVRVNFPPVYDKYDGWSQGWTDEYKVKALPKGF